VVGVAAPLLKLHVFCLSLRRTSDRRARFEAEAHRVGLLFQFCDAPDATTLAPEALLALADQDRAVARFGRPLGLTEIACAEGHRQIYRRLADSDADAAVVFEDDVTLDDRVVDVVNGLKGLDGQFGDLREVHLLGGREGYEDYPLWLSRKGPRALPPAHALRRVVKSDRALQRTCSYVITRAAARAILESEPAISASADQWDLRLVEGTLQAIWVLQPSVAFHPRESADSLLQAERLVLEAEVSRRRLAQGLVRRAGSVAASPRRLVRSLAYRLGWRRAKRIVYAWLSRAT